MRLMHYEYRLKKLKAGEHSTLMTTLMRAVHPQFKQFRCPLLQTIKCTLIGVDKYLGDTTVGFGSWDPVA